MLASVWLWFLWKILTHGDLIINLVSLVIYSLELPYKYVYGVLTHLANDAVDVLVLLINLLAHCTSKAVQTLSSAVESIEIGVNLLRG